ncbi:MAG: proline dehydrogenase family protein [Dehalococcoidia bacterium]
MAPPPDLVAAAQHHEADAPITTGPAPAPAWATVARAALLWLSQRQALQRLVAEVGPARALARRFVAGERRADALATVRGLAAEGIRATVAYLGEHTTDPALARAAAAENERLLHGLAAEGWEPNCSLKLTQLGLSIDPALAEEGLRRALAAAAAVRGFVRIDMEGSDVLPATLALFERVTAGRPRPGRVGVVIQAYLRRSEGDLRRLIATGAPVRLVKGAYAEPPSVAFATKREVDAAYLRLAGLLLSPEAREAGVYPAFATHDTALIGAIRRMTRDRAIPAENWEVQMLLGVRRDLQRSLALDGVRVRAYVPYGDHWYPYFMRRLAERPENLGFIVRQVVRR